MILFFKKIEFKPFFVVKKWLTGSDKGGLGGTGGGGFRLGGGFKLGGGGGGGDDLTGAILIDVRDNRLIKIYFNHNFFNYHFFFFSERYFKLDGAFIAIGHKPITKFLKGAVNTDAVNPNFIYFLFLEIIMYCSLNLFKNAFFFSFIKKGWLYFTL